VDALVGGHGGRGVYVGLVRRAGLGALGECQHEHRAEPAGQPAERAGADVAAEGLAGVIAEERDPVRLVAGLGVGEGEQDLALLAAAASGEVAVHGGFGALVGQVLAPSADGRGCWGGHVRSFG
jgi:hypothetical protein